MRFRLTPRSMTLDDLELLIRSIFFGISCDFVIWDATTVRMMAIDPQCLRQNCSPLSVIFSDVEITLIVPPLGSVEQEWSGENKLL